MRVRIDLGAAQPARADEIGVLAGQPDRIAARTVDRRYQLFVDRARQHHLDDIDGFAIGDTEAVNEAALDLEPLQHLADLRSASMNDDRIDAHLLQQHDVVGETLAAFGIAHGVTAVFHHYGLCVIAAEEGQRLREDGGACAGIDGHQLARSVTWRQTYQAARSLASAARAARSAGMPEPLWALVRCITGCAATWRRSFAAVASSTLAN